MEATIQEKAKKGLNLETRFINLENEIKKSSELIDDYVLQISNGVSVEKNIKKAKKQKQHQDLLILAKKKIGYEIYQKKGLISYNERYNEFVENNSDNPQEKWNELLKERRYKKYLILKKEFDN